MLHPRSSPVSSPLVWERRPGEEGDPLEKGEACKIGSETLGPWRHGLLGVVVVFSLVFLGGQEEHTARV